MHDRVVTSCEYDNSLGVSTRVGRAVSGDSVYVVSGNSECGGRVSGADELGCGVSDAGATGGWAGVWNNLLLHREEPERVRRKRFFSRVCVDSDARAGADAFANAGDNARANGYPNAGAYGDGDSSYGTAMEAWVVEMNWRWPR